MAFDPQEEREYLSFRVAIASGLFASLGASLAWLLWLAWQVPRKELATTVIVGAFVGVIVAWCERYLHIAGHERERKHPPESNRTRAALIWAAGFGFLGLASEHLVADMAARFLQPLLASLSTLLPAGLILGLSMHLGSTGKKSTSDVFIEGLVTGALVAAVTGSIWWLGWGHVPWGAIFCWWCLVGLGMRLFSPTEVNATRFHQPVCGVIAAFVITILLSMLPATGSFYVKTGPIGSGVFLARAMALEVMSEPGVPSEFWRRAQNDLAENEAPNPNVATQTRPSFPSLAGQTTPPPPASMDNFAKQIGPGLNKTDIPETRTRARTFEEMSKELNDPHASVPGANPQPSGGPESLDKQLKDFRALAPNPDLFHKMENPEKALNDALNAKATSSGGLQSWQLVWKELQKGFASPLVRSWLVLLFFSFGLGIAPSIERALRPPDYPSSATFKKDITIAVFLIAVIVTACLYSRFATAEPDSPGPQNSLPVLPD